MSLSAVSSRSEKSPYWLSPVARSRGGIKKGITVEQREKLHALAANPHFAGKLLAAIERSPRVANALWDICGVAYLTMATLQS